MPKSPVVFGIKVNVLASCSELKPLVIGRSSLYQAKVAVGLALAAHFNVVA